MDATTTTSSTTETIMKMMEPNLRTIRIFLSPYLPPEFTRAMRSIDSSLQDMLGISEASTLLLCSSLLGVLLIYILKTLFVDILNPSSKRKLFLLDENDVLGAIDHDKKHSKKNEDVNVNVNGTIVICGPSNSGKTVLFHALCCDELLLNLDDDEKKNIISQKLQSTSTVTSIQAIDVNLPILSSSSNNNNEKEKAHVRVIDFPGHPSLRNTLPQVLAKKEITKIVLVLDSSKPVSDAADILYMILTHSSLPWNNNNNKSNRRRMQVLIACHKSDLPLARNPKRIKIQLRTELERLRKIQKATSKEKEEDNISSSSNNNTKALCLGTPGKVIDLDNKNGDLSCDLSFGIVSCKIPKKKNGSNIVNKGWKDVSDFIYTNL